MRQLRQTSSHMAQVIENGRVVGVVTLEDIIEELVGTVRDWTHDD
jgi:CBS domain containing-hemolysin-like protein